MEGEFKNLILVWSMVLASLFYCHTISKIFINGISRFLSILPVNLLFLVLPLNLSSILFGGTTCFLIAWLANFKLILFAFNKGPLFSSNPSLSLSQFVVVACFPIKIRHTTRSSKHTSLRNTILIRIVLLPILIYTLRYREFIHPEIMLSFLGLRIGMTLELLLAVSAALSRPILSPQLEFEPPFDNYHLSTSVQNYWGKRWNLVVSDILRLTVYQPVRSFSARFITEKWACIPAVMATFMVSGLMHELVFYNFARVKPSGYLLCYFLVHGVAVSVEIVLKKKLGGESKVNRIVSWQLTMGFMSYTGSWLFIQPVLAAKSDLRTCNEAMAFFEFLFRRRLVNPADLRCPLP